MNFTYGGSESGKVHSQGRNALRPYPVEQGVLYAKVNCTLLAWEMLYVSSLSTNLTINVTLSHLHQTFSKNEFVFARIYLDN